MNDLYVPITGRDNVDLNKLLVELKKIGAKRVFLSSGRFVYERGEARDKDLARVKEIADFFHNEGFEVGSWICSLGFGGPTLEANKKIAAPYTRITSVTGVTGDDAICPMDNYYVEMMADLAEDICRYTGVDMLMLDDEMCLNIRPGALGCACELHMSELRRRLGENVKREDLIGLIYCGGRSIYRDTWIEVMADSMRNFCRKIREGVDRVSKKIPVGFCSGYTSWDLECADALELTEILAGESGKPFLRVTGANYWIHTNRFPRQNLATIIECVRMQNAWSRGRGIDLFSEGDNYPRDRFQTSAASAECYDIGCRIDGGMASFKYMFNYACEADLDTGYIKAHMRNVPIYEKIDEHFASKEAVGVRVYEEMRKFKNFDFPKKYAGDKAITKRTFFSSAQALLTAHGIPTTYEGRGICGIAFGENAKYIDDEAIGGGLILDAKAAMILEERGVDVGLNSYKNIPAGFMERFDGRYNDVELFSTSEISALDLKDGAKVQSRFTSCDFTAKIEYPASYTYENAKGQRFLVYAFVGEQLTDNSTLMLSYARGRQINDTFKWLCGDEIPVRVDDHPYLYCIAKEGDGALAAGYINCHNDAVYDAEIKLDRDVKNVEFIGCNGRIENARTIIIDHIPAYGFGGIVVK